MIEAIRILLLLVHLLANALAGGAPLIAAVLPGCSETRRRLAGGGLLALMVGLLAGGLSTLLVLGGAWPAYASAAGRLPARAYLMLGWEWAFSAALMAVYYYTWPRLSSRRIVHGLLAVIASTNLLYHFPTMMVVLRLLAEDPMRTAEPMVSREVFLAVLWAPLPMGLTLHFWALSLLTPGLVMRTLSVSEPHCARAGSIVALSGGVGLFLSGVWCLLHVNARSARELVSVDGVAGWFFLAGVGCAVWLLAGLTHDAFSRSGTSRRVLTPALLAALLMAAAARSL